MGSPPSQQGHETMTWILTQAYGRGAACARRSPALPPCRCIDPPAKISHTARTTERRTSGEEHPMAHSAWPRTTRPVLIPTVSLYVISLVASSCWDYRSQID